MTSIPKILLVYPNITKAERYRGKLGLFGGKQIPLGLYYRAAYLRKNGGPAGAVDAEAGHVPPTEIVDLLRQGGYQALGISTTTVSFHRALELAQTVKQAWPDLPILVGGPHVSSQPLQPLEFPAFDYAIRNEGEESLLETLRMLDQRSDPALVAGLIHRRDGRVVVNPARPYIDDLDSLPFPAYDLIPDLGVYTPPPFNYRRRPVANIITSRGCPNACTFCENTTFGRKVRMRSAESIVDEIELLMTRHGVREIAFVDDTFTVRPARIYEIFELAGRRGLRFPWTCMSRVNTVDEDLLRFMKASGCWYISFGIESGDEAILKEIRKNIRLEDVSRVVDICRRIGIRTKGFFIVGHPKETEETIDRTIAFARGLKLDHVVVTVNTPMPGSHQYEHAREFGSLDESSWATFNYWHPVFVPAGMSREQLLRKHGEFIRRFYLRPGLLARQAGTLAGDRNTYRQLWDLGRDLVRAHRLAKTNSR
ncbi:MAG: radical SAM protein [Acidobacteria bacterium]|nr:radical SAM protein [Acidobacteriota bacterium]